MHLDRSAVLDAAEAAHVTGVEDVLHAAAEQACAERVAPCLGPAGWAVGPNRAGDRRLPSTWAACLYALVVWDPEGTTGAHMAVGVGRCESAVGLTAGFSAKRAHYASSLRTRFREVLGTVDRSRVTLVVVWSAPPGISYHSVADAVLSEVEDAAIMACHRLRRAQDVRFATILNKCRATRCLRPCGSGPFFLARAERFMVSMRLFREREGHCNPEGVVEGLSYPGDFALDASLNRTYAHLVHPGSPLGWELTYMAYQWGRKACALRWS